MSRLVELAEAVRNLTELLEREQQDRDDGSLSEEQLIGWLGEEYGRHVIACRIRLSQARELLVKIGGEA